MHAQTLSAAAPAPSVAGLPAAGDLVDVVDSPASELFAATTAQYVARLRRHPFIDRCRAGRASRHELETFLVQHGRYGAYFTRFLCALMSNLDAGDDVLRLAENLSEELGYGHDADDRTPHARIYADMLASFGLQGATDATLPYTQALIDTMFTLCRQPGGISGLGALCLGAEAIVPALYSDLIAGLDALGATAAQLTFFHLHVACDDSHAETMRDILRRMIEADPAARIAALNAGEIALRARLRFLDGIAAAAPR